MPPAILRFVDALEGSPTQDPHSLMILRHGNVIAQGWGAPYAAQRRHLLYSLSKSFTSAAAGIAISEDLLRLDDPAILYFPEFDADVTDARSRSILVRHRASMSTGHTFDTLEQAQHADPAELVRGFLMLPLSATPAPSSHTTSRPPTRLPPTQKPVTVRDVLMQNRQR